MSEEASPHRARIARDLLTIGVLLAFLAAWDASGIDIDIARRFGTASGFAWKNHWFTAGLMHDGVRWVAWGALAALIWTFWRRRWIARDLTTGERFWWLLTTLVCAAAIPLIKRQSLTSCPWSLAEFGGVASYVPHWVLGRGDGGSGGCFPSGHASTAFAFIAGWFVMRDRSARLAGVWLVGVVTVGLALGAVQVVRGAHYPSHVLWTAWICWVMSAASYHLFRWRSTVSQ